MPHKAPYDPLVLASKAALMQRLADYVRLGYRYWTSGEIPLDRANRLVDKFHRLYEVGRSRNQRCSAKRDGIANSVLLLYLPHTATAAQHASGQEPYADTPRPYAESREPQRESIRWFLLATEGDGLVHEQEKLRDAWSGSAQDRLQLTGYELVKLPRPGRAEPSWTWRMTKETYDAWRSRVIDTARRPGMDTTSLIELLYRSPGFAGIRSQVGKIAGLLRREWKRHRAEPFGGLPRLGYAQRLPSRGTPLSRFTRNR